MHELALFALLCLGSVMTLAVVSGIRDHFQARKLHRELGNTFSTRPE